MSNKRLLILSCSAKKTGVKKCPAIDRYLSPSFYLVRKWLREKESEHIAIWIVSAFYGLIDFRKPIENYDVRLTPERANLLQPKLKQQVTILTKLYFGDSQPVEVFGHLPKEYTALIDDHLNWKKHLPVRYAAGKPGIKLQQLKEWLETDNGMDQS